MRCLRQTRRLLSRRISPVPEHQDSVDYIFDLPIEEALARLYPRYIEVTIFRAILESAAAAE